MSSVRKTFGLACPNCGSDEHITVEVTSWIRLDEGGTEQVGDQEWAINSPCRCDACDTLGDVTSFTAPDQDGDE